MKRTRRKQKTKKIKSRRNHRKYKGGNGNNDNSGYVLAGFVNDVQRGLGYLPQENTLDPLTGLPIKRGKQKPLIPILKVNRINVRPIFMLKCPELKTSKDLRQMIQDTDLNPSKRLVLFIPVLYNLNFRGIDLSILRDKKPSLPKYTYLFDGTTCIYGQDGSSSDYSPNIYKSSYCPSNQWEGYVENMRNTELKYPGLFTRMFISEEEEEEALRRVQEKENEKEQIKKEMIAEIDREYNEM